MRPLAVIELERRGEKSPQWTVDLWTLSKGIAYGVVRHVSGYELKFNRKLNATGRAFTVNVTEDLQHKRTFSERFRDTTLYVRIPMRVMMEHRDHDLPVPPAEIDEMVKLSPPLELHCVEKIYRRHENEFRWEAHDRDFTAWVYELSRTRAKGEWEGSGVSRRDFNVKRRNSYFRIGLRLSEEHHHVYSQEIVNIQFNLPEEHCIDKRTRNYEARMMAKQFYDGESAPPAKAKGHKRKTAKRRLKKR